MDESKTLYTRLGDHRVLTDIIEIFYDKVMADETLAPFFSDVDMLTQRRKQIMFMVHILCGIKTPPKKSMGEVHAHAVKEQGLDDEHFDAFAGHLRDTLREKGIAEELIAEVSATIERFREEVLGR